MIGLWCYTIFYFSFFFMLKETAFAIFITSLMSFASYSFIFPGIYLIFFSEKTFFGASWFLVLIWTHCFLGLLYSCILGISFHWIPGKLFMWERILKCLPTDHFHSRVSVLFLFRSRDYKQRVYMYIYIWCK